MFIFRAFCPAARFKTAPNSSSFPIRFSGIRHYFLTDGMNALNLDSSALKAIKITADSLTA
jgi:hypothetical protein